MILYAVYPNKIKLLNKIFNSQKWKLVYLKGKVIEKIKITALDLQMWGSVKVGNRTSLYVGRDLPPF